MPLLCAGAALPPVNFAGGGGRLLIDDVVKEETKKETQKSLLSFSLNLLFFFTFVCHFFLCSSLSSQNCCVRRLHNVLSTRIELRQRRLSLATLPNCAPHHQPIHSVSLSFLR
jgi:hypothetical protein